MAGLVPAIRGYLNKAMAAGGWFYFMTNRRNGILYAGVTANLPRRA
jgi:putative endonuclease